MACRAASCARAAGVSPGRSSPDELRAAIHEEIDRLPEGFRVPLILCDLEGRTHAAARELACPVGTIKSRLARGRERLRARLARRGLAPSAATIASALGADSADPTAMTSARAARLATLHQATEPGPTSAAVDLARQLTREFAMQKLVKAALAAVAVGLIGALASAVARQDGPTAPRPAPASPRAVEPTSPTLADVAGQVRADEGRYRDLELEATRLYRDPTPAPVDPRPIAAGAGPVPVGDDPGRVFEKIETIRLVRRGPPSYNRKTSAGKRADGGQFRDESVRAHDGRTTRRVDGQVANIEDGPPDEAGLPRPHTLALPDWAGFDSPLSTYLDGDAAADGPARPFPGRKSNVPLALATTVVGRETVDGLRCVRLRLETRVPGRKPQLGYFVRDLWLAVDRNYLPVRVEGRQVRPDSVQ